MPEKTRIDTDAANSGLAASAQMRSTAIAGTDITLPQGLYVGATNALAAAMIAARLGNLSTRVSAGAVAAASSVATYEATEQANATTLTT